MTRPINLVRHFKRGVCVCMCSDCKYRADGWPDGDYSVICPGSHETATPRAGFVGTIEQTMVEHGDSEIEIEREVVPLWEQLWAAQRSIGTSLSSRGSFAARR